MSEEVPWTMGREWQLVKAPSYSNYFQHDCDPTWGVIGIERGRVGHSSSDARIDSIQLNRGYSRTTFYCVARGRAMFWRFIKNYIRIPLVRIFKRTSTF